MENCYGTICCLEHMRLNRKSEYDKFDENEKARVTIGGRIIYAQQTADQWRDDRLGQN